MKRFLKELKHPMTRALAVSAATFLLSFAAYGRLSAELLALIFFFCTFATLSLAARVAELEDALKWYRERPEEDGGR